MNCIKILTDEDFGLVSKEFNNPRIRYGARGLVFNKDGKIAILYKKNKNQYKLIGGGIDGDEDPVIAFKREVEEEAGVIIKNIEFIGTIEEHKSQDNFKQTSYVYTADVDSITKTDYTPEEIEDGAELLWLMPIDAFLKIRDCENRVLASKYEGDMGVYHNKFIVRRDYEILKYYAYKSN